MREELAREQIHATDQQPKRAASVVADDAE